MLPGFLTPPLLTIVQKQLKRAKFTTTDEVAQKDGRVFGNTLKLLQTDPGVVALNFILNRPALFDIAMEVGSVPPVGHFLGRLHRTTPDSDQHIDWHNDAGNFKVLGLDINLSTDAYTGGLFQMRDGERRVRREIQDWQPGDAFLFRIGREWEHRLTRVESGTRTVGVGWFRTHPDWTVYYPYATPHISAAGKTV